MESAGALTPDMLFYDTNNVRLNRPRTKSNYYAVHPDLEKEKEGENNHCSLRQKEKKDHVEVEDIQRKNSCRECFFDTILVFANLTPFQFFIVYFLPI